MVSSPTTILRLEKQGQSDNPGSWWIPANQLIQSIEDAIAGFADISGTGGTTTLTPLNYETDNPRKAYLRISSGQTLVSDHVVVSATPRAYFVHNASSAGSFSVKFGGSVGNALTIPRGYGCFILIRSDLTTIFASPLVAVASGLIHADNYASLTAKFPIKSENVGIAVISSTLATQPGSPTTGDRYILPSTGLVGAAWTGHEADIAEYNGATWDFTNAVAGMLAFDKANHYLLGFDTQWRIAGGSDVLPTGGVTYCLFLQAAAPTGWTKQTTHNDKTLRIVSGTPGAGGGSVDFSTLFARTATDGFSLLQGHLPNIDFQFTNTAFLTNVAAASTVDVFQSSGISVITALAKTYGATVISVPSGGSDTAHTHPIDLRVKYTEALIATRD